MTDYENTVSEIMNRFPDGIQTEDESRIMAARARHPKAIENIEKQYSIEDLEDKVCHICGTKCGWDDIGEDSHGYHYVAPCVCQQMAAVKNNIEKSGLSSIMQEYTFDAFQTDNEYRRIMAQTAAAYVQEYLSAVQYAKKPWMFIGGQTGCGKTHICTAAVGKLLSENVPCVYMEWIKDAGRLKASVNDTEHAKFVERYTEPDVLYIDDLFKCKNGAVPSDAEIRLAFDILNTRYTRNKATIISSEWSLPKLMEQDQATFSRVNERCKGFSVYINDDVTKNWRLNQ